MVVSLHVYIIKKGYEYFNFKRMVFTDDFDLNCLSINDKFIMACEKEYGGEIELIVLSGKVPE